MVGKKKKKRKSVCSKWKGSMWPFPRGKRRRRGGNSVPRKHNLRRKSESEKGEKKEDFEMMSGGGSEERSDFQSLVTLTKIRKNGNGRRRRRRGWRKGVGVRKVVGLNG